MTDIEANDTTLRLERMIAVPPETLFALWVDPAQLIKWWAPDGYQGGVKQRLGLTPVALVDIKLFLEIAPGILDAS